MNDTLKMYGSIGSEIMNIYFVVAMCFKSQPRWRRLQTTYIDNIGAFLRCDLLFGGRKHSL